MQSHDGFTLFEIIMILMIMSIVTVVVVMRWPGYSINLGAQAQQLASDIRFTQALSMSTNQRYYLAINTGSRSYQIRNASGTAVVMANGANTVVLGTGIAFGTLSNLPSSLIAFNGAGAPYTTSIAPGTALAATAGIPLTTGSVTITVFITPGTGRVLVS